MSNQQRGKSMNYYAHIEITNYDEILSFAKSLTRIPEFCKLSSAEKLKIIYSYPFIYEIVSKTF